MIRTLALKKNGTIQQDVPLDKLDNPQVIWYWVDFNNPSFEEISTLKNHFHFHPFAMEDCLDGQIQRPKVQSFTDFHFLILHAIQSPTNKPNEVNLFVSDKFLVSFHYKELKEIDVVWQEISLDAAALHKNSLYPIYKIVDHLVDSYFPVMHQIEEKVESMENTLFRSSSKNLMNQLFRVRNQLSRLRRSVDPMRDLIYRVIHSKRIDLSEEERIYLDDIDDNLTRLSQKIDAHREITADIQDNHFSVNAYRMNSVMMALTLVTTIFMPLTFIAGIYGMNFEYMPELKWRYSYFVLLGIMATIGLSLYGWFKRKGWF